MFEQFRGLHGLARPRVSTPRRRSLEVEQLEERSLLSAGFLDSSFGNGGLASAHFNGFDSSSAIGAVVQPDGKIVVAGGTASGSVGTNNSFALARFNANGSLDNTFGTGGEVTTPLGQAAGVVLQADGKIVVGGTSNTSSFAVARYNTDGSLDSTFASGGTVTTAVNGDTVTTVLLQPDGKIVLVGIDLASDGTTDLVRYNSDGSLDASFGTGGKATGFSGRAGTAALQSDGKIVVPETSVILHVGVFDDDFYATTSWFLIRINPNGSQDSSFTPLIEGSQDGRFAGRYEGFGVAIQTDGKILTSGFANHSAMARLNPDGTLDTTFGVNGKFLTPVSGKLVIQSDGRILVAGERNGLSGSGGLVRYLPDGSLDTRFGIDGSASSFPSFPSDLTAGVTLQADGSILVTGGLQAAASGNNTDLAVGRYQGGPSMALTGTLNQRFVEQVYLDVLGRPVDSSGLAFWSSLVDRGQLTRTQVVLGIEQSAEYRALVVENLYDLYFNRPADASGLAGWTSFLAAGGTTDQLRAALLGSDEYVQAPFLGTATTPSVLAAGFLQGLYHDVLHRTPDSAGFMAWTQVLNAGFSRTAVAGAFITSAEGASDEVQDLYHRLLHRAPDTVGMSQFGNLLEHGVSEDLVLALIAGSDEYAAHL